jgi:DNA-binding MarR family transcriptional regulator
VSFNAVDAVIAASFDRDRFMNAEFRLLVVLARHRNRHTGRCDPGLKVLADETGFSKSYVVQLVRALEDRGELAADHAPKGGRGHRTRYAFPLAKGHSRVTLSEGPKGHWATPIAEGSNGA